MIQLKLNNVKKDTPANFAFIGTVFTTIGSTIGSYGLTASNEIVGFIGLGCAVLGVILTLFANKKQVEQSNNIDNGTENETTNAK